MEQIERVANRLRNRTVKGIYSSDLTRAHKGADILARHFSNVPRKEFRDLREVKQEIWESLTFKEYNAPYKSDQKQKNFKVV